MLLDLAKLFPNACKARNISTLKVNYEDIKSFHRKDNPDKPDTFLDIIQLKDQIITFDGIDRGIFTLAGIDSAKRILSEFEIARKEISGFPADFLKAEKEAAINYLQMINSLYS